MISRIEPLVVLAAAIVTTGLSIFATLAEADVYSAPASGINRWAGLAAAVPAVGLSLLSRQSVMDTCVEAQTSVAGRLQATDVRNAIALSCRAASAALVDEMPTYAYAYLVRAISSAASDTAAMNEALVLSQHFAPAEGWLAGPRVDLAEGHRTALSAEAKAAEEADIVLMLLSNQGPPFLARRYVGDPMFRERLTAIGEQLPGAAQKRLLDEIIKANAAQ